jgi:ATP-dependent helicase HrpB
MARCVRFSLDLPAHDYCGERLAVTNTTLAIEPALESLISALDSRTAAVLVAPTGAGKTTRVPLELLDTRWIEGRKLLILEPRRIAARAAAERMAKTLGERVGQTVGLRSRVWTVVGPKTRLEVITEGVFTRMIVDDPSLMGVGAVLFDEFHERSLDADFGLALALDAQQGMREDLRILVMSATLKGARVAKLLGNAPVIESKGHAFPIETIYVGRDATRRIEEQMADTIVRALAAQPGSILAFLPGKSEIQRVAKNLDCRIKDRNIDIAPLFGAMDPREQDFAIAGALPGRRKIVLATSIAETSLTIEGVRVVIDCGLARVPRYEPEAGATRLETVRVSRAGADQRRGRAGRTEAGVCYRLWDEPETQSLPEAAEPEIRNCDLSSLLLDCAAWGITDPRGLNWLDPPTDAGLKAARLELTSLGALDGDGRITNVGRQLRALPLPARLARMLSAAAELGAEVRTSLIVALLVERDLGGTETDLDLRLERFLRDGSQRARAMRRSAKLWAGSVKQGTKHQPVSVHSTARLLALAFPDRIAKARGAVGQFLLASGRGAYLDPTDPLARSPYLVVADMSGAAVATRILAAVALEERELLEIAASRIRKTIELYFDADARAVRARRIQRLDAILLAKEPLNVTANHDTAVLLAEGVAKLGIDKLPWTKAQMQLRDRVAFMRSTEINAWPDLSDAALAQGTSDWLAPYLTLRMRFSEIDCLDLGRALNALLAWELRQRLDNEAPTQFEAPSGNRYPINYQGSRAPSLSIRVQELFGLKHHPAIANGRLPLTLELLSPAHRPIQITRDLPGFWQGSWADVKAEMRGRYPKHFWPDDPASAVATARAKPRRA